MTQQNQELTLLAAKLFLELRSRLINHFSEIQDVLRLHSSTITKFLFSLASTISFVIVLPVMFGEVTGITSRIALSLVEQVVRGSIQGSTSCNLESGDEIVWITGTLAWAIFWGAILGTVMLFSAVSWNPAVSIMVSIVFWVALGLGFIGARRVTSEVPLFLITERIVRG